MRAVCCDDKYYESVDTVPEIARPRNRFGNLEGHSVDMEGLSTLSPYRTEHINRFGNYVINPNRMPEPLEQHLGLSLSPVSA
jgi:hypothetical protein